MLERFKNYLINEKLSHNTIQSYLNDISLFLKFFNDHFGEDIKELNHIEVTEYIKELKRLNFTATSINRKLAALSRYNHFLIEIKVQSEMVISKRDYIKIQAKLTAPYAPPKRDVTKIRLSAKDSKRDLAILTLLAYSRNKRI